jgi:glycosyltransferase involved in cell wall biosynthesis
MKKIKVAISQRIIPEYRIGVFTELSQRESLDVTVYYGRGLDIGTEVNADIISGFNHKQLFSVILPFYQQKTQRLRVWHPALLYHLIRNKVDVVLTEPISNIFNLFSIFLYCKILGKAYVWHEPGGAKSDKRRFARKLIDPMISLFIKNATSYATYNSYSDYFLKEYYNVDEKLIFRAQNALDTDAIEQQISHFEKIPDQNPLINLKKNFKLILFIGALEKRKRVNNLITAVTRMNTEFNIPSICLVIGNGPDENWIKDQCTYQENKFVRFLGKHIDDVVSYILISDLVVLPGQGGLSLNHALACGKPIIATIEGLVPFSTSVYDYIEQGENGFVVKVNDINDLTTNMAKCMTDADLYKEMCIKAKRKSEEFTAAKMADGFEQAILYAYENTSN